jgi:hypothetical protein
LNFTELPQQQTRKKEQTMIGWQKKKTQEQQAKATKAVTGVVTGSGAQKQEGYEIRVQKGM